METAPSYTAYDETWIFSNVELQYRYGTLAALVKKPQAEEKEWQL